MSFERELVPRGKEMALAESDGHVSGEGQLGGPPLRFHLLGFSGSKMQTQSSNFRKRGFMGKKDVPGKGNGNPQDPSSQSLSLPERHRVSCPLSSPCPVSASVLVTLGFVSQECFSQLAQFLRPSTGVFQGRNEWVHLSGARLLAGQPCGSAAGAGDRVGLATTLCLCPAADPPEPSAA